MNVRTIHCYLCECSRVYKVRTGVLTNNSFAAEKCEVLGNTRACCNLAKQSAWLATNEEALEKANMPIQITKLTHYKAISIS